MHSLNFQVSCFYKASIFIVFMQVSGALKVRSSQPVTRSTSISGLIPSIISQEYCRVMLLEHSAFETAIIDLGINVYTHTIQ